MPSTRRTRGAGFTLLEIMAVVAIFALLAGIALPNFSGLQSRNLKHQANRIVAQIEMARQRAIVTGIPHRFTIDIEGGAYRIDWFVSAEQLARAADDGSDSAGATGAGVDLDSGVPLDLSAPRGLDRSYHPVPGLSGRDTFLDGSVDFTGVETTGGWLEDGEAFIEFERDGSANATVILIEHESGLALSLEVLPLADSVRIYDETV